MLAWALGLTQKHGVAMGQEVESPQASAALLEWQEYNRQVSAEGEEKRETLDEYALRLLQPVSASAFRRSQRVVPLAERHEHIADLRARGLNALADEMLASEKRRARAEQQRKAQAK